MTKETIKNEPPRNESYVSHSHAKLEMWQGPWNDDPHGPYYKIPCEEYRRAEIVKAELIAQIFSQRDELQSELTAAKVTIDEYRKRLAAASL